MVIKLNMGKSVLVDDEDWESLKDYKWKIYQWGDYLYVATIIDRKLVYMHHLILGKAVEIDHKNHDTLDNRKENLRIVSRSQQHMNQKIRSDNRSGYKGVSWHSTRGKWTARIAVEGKRKTIGYFTDKVEAAKAYDQAALEYYGEYAYINFPS